MPEQPLTDAELQEFIALDDGRPDLSWRYWMPDYRDDWTSMAIRMARRMAEELLRRRQAAQEMTDTLDRIGRDDASAMDGYHEDKTLRLLGA